MKIVHVCLEAPYIDGWGYQENEIPACHAKLGHDVTVIGSLNDLPGYVYNVKETAEKRSPYMVGEVRVVRIAKTVSLFARINYYPDLPRILDEESPDLLYHHGGQSLSLIASRNYVRTHRLAALVVDFHAEYYNTATNYISRVILHKIIWKAIIQYCLPYIKDIYCISPSVKKLCMDLYGISADKIKYLYLGTNVPEEMLAEREYIRREVRANYGIPESSFVIITGGKLNFDKRLDILVDALKNLNNENIYLLVFGTSDPEERDYAEKIIGKVSRIVMLGWCDAAAITRYYLAADIAIFPGGQSVLWQQAIGTGLPAIFRRWPGNEYLNIGNALFLYSESSEELAQSIELLLEPRNTWMLCDMRDKALELARTKISYRHEAVEIIKSAMRKK